MSFRVEVGRSGRSCVDHAPHNAALVNVYGKHAETVRERDAKE